MFEFLRMPCGLTNAPAAFQMLMNFVLGGLKWISALMYLDDVISFESTFDEHLQRLKWVVAAAKQGELREQPEKCQFGLKEIHFLGHIVDAGRSSSRPDG